MTNSIYRVFIASSYLQVYLFVFAFITTSSYSQSTLNRSLISTIGGSGNAGNIHYDYSVGEPVLVWGGPYCDSIFSGFQHCAVDTLRFKQPNLVVGGPTTICPNTSVVLTAPSGPGFSWQWSNGPTTQTIAASQTGTYSARITNICGDTMRTKKVVVTVLTPPTPTICMVTVDSASFYNYNIVYWDNLAYPTADTFIVYRYDASLNSYLRIGAVDKNISELKDTARYTGSSAGTNGDPNYGSSRYKIAIKESCNVAGALSPYHQTEFIQRGTGGNFSVSQYIIEATQANTVVTGYRLMRDNTGNGVYVQIASINNGQTLVTDAAYQNFPNANYRIDVLGFNCVASSGNDARAATIKQKSHSNTADKTAPSGLTRLPLLHTFKLFPNPSTKVLNLEVSSIQPGVEVLLTDLSGRLVMNGGMMLQNQAELDISQLDNGVYFVSYGRSVQKFVKN